MKNKNGFTLVETMGVLILLAVILTLVIPSLTKWLKNADSSIDKATEKLILDAVEDYVDESDNIIFSSSDYEYCLELSELINAGYISEEAVSKLEGKNITIKITYASGETKYNFDSDCTVETE